MKGTQLREQLHHRQVNNFNSSKSPWNEQHGLQELFYKSDLQLGDIRGMELACGDQDVSPTEVVQGTALQASQDGGAKKILTISVRCVELDAWLHCQLCYRGVQGDFPNGPVQGMGSPQ